MSLVYIKNIDKIVLLRALWLRSSPEPYHLLNRIQFDENLAKQKIGKYIFMFKQRHIKADLSGDTVDPTEYDFDMGPGAFKEVVLGITEK